MAYIREKQNFTRILEVFIIRKERDCCDYQHSHYCQSDSGRSGACERCRCEYHGLNLLEIYLKIVNRLQGK